jgi:hypothetical protein
MNSFKITHDCTQCELGVVSFAIFSSCGCRSATGATTFQNFNTLMNNKTFDVELGQTATKIDL